MPISDWLFWNRTSVWRFLLASQDSFVLILQSPPQHLVLFYICTHIWSTVQRCRYIYLHLPASGILKRGLRVRSLLSPTFVLLYTFPKLASLRPHTPFLVSSTHPLVYAREVHYYLPLNRLRSESVDKVSSRL